MLSKGTMVGSFKLDVKTVFDAPGIFMQLFKENYLLLALTIIFLNYLILFISRI